MAHGGGSSMNAVVDVVVMTSEAMCPRPVEHFTLPAVDLEAARRETLARCDGQQIERVKRTDTALIEVWLKPEA